ncbi:hypothetical protein ACI78V_07730 [Geodermatophilus sp. SYSU D00742]
MHTPALVGPAVVSAVELPALTFDRSVDVGAFLAFVTLVAGFLAWVYKTVKEWRRDAMREAQNGALRLLLKILRERYARDGEPVTFLELRADFERPERKAERKAYTGRDFRFTGDPHFEQAVYALHWEFKVDFAPGDRILFRAHRDEPVAHPRLEVQLPATTVLQTFENALADPGVSGFELETLGRLAAAADPDRTVRVIRDEIAAADGDAGRCRHLLGLTARLRGW